MKFRGVSVCCFHILVCLPMAGLITADGLTRAAAADWPQWRGPGRDGVWHESGLIDQFAERQIPIRWRQPIGSGYSGPTVSNGRVLVMDRLIEPAQQERILCFDQQTGEPQWVHAYPCRYDAIDYDAGPRAAVTIDDARAYALGATGQLHCLDVEDGTVVWQVDLNEAYEIYRRDREENRMPIWGIAAAPLVYRDTLILHVGGRDGACVLGLHKQTGTERWRALDDRAQYSAPVLTRQAGRDLVIVWTGDSVAGLSPETGQVCWRNPFPPSRMPIGVATPLVHDGHLFVTSFYDGSLMLKMDPDELQVTRVWQARGPDEQQTEALHSIISTPIWLGEHIYGVDSYGQLRCLEGATGRRVWEDLTATPRVRWGTVHFVRQGDRVWMFNERGELILGKLTPEGFEEIDRAQLLQPTRVQLSRRGGVCWSHPAFAGGHVFARNDEELVCADLRSSD